MQNSNKKKKWGGLLTVAFLFWFVCNIRVAAGIGTTFERAIDGMVGISLLVGVVFLVLDFFNVIGKDKEEKTDQ